MVRFLPLADGCRKHSRPDVYSGLHLYFFQYIGTKFAFNPCWLTFFALSCALKGSTFLWRRLLHDGLRQCFGERVIHQDAVLIKYR